MRCARAAPGLEATQRLDAYRAPYPQAMFEAAGEHHPLQIRISGILAMMRYPLCRAPDATIVALLSRSHLEADRMHRLPGRSHEPSRQTRTETRTRAENPPSVLTRFVV